MSFVTGQVSASTAAALLCVVPPGPVLVVLSSDSASSSTAFVGNTPSSPAVFTTSNGVPLPAGASLTFAAFATSQGGSLSVIAATTATVGYIISSDR
jgi:hypothetical protein